LSDFNNPKDTNPPCHSACPSAGGPVCHRQGRIFFNATTEVLTEKIPPERQKNEFGVLPERIAPGPCITRLPAQAGNNRLFKT